MKPFWSIITPFSHHQECPCPLPHATSPGGCTDKPLNEFNQERLPLGNSICSHYTSEEFHCLRPPVQTTGPGSEGEGPHGWMGTASGKRVLPDTEQN